MNVCILCTVMAAMLICSVTAVSESTPGSIAVNIATFIGSSQGGLFGAFVATLGVVLPSFLIILLIAAVLKNLMKYAGVNAFLSGVRPCVVAMVLATGINMALPILAGYVSKSTNQPETFHLDMRSVSVFLILITIHFLYKKIQKRKPSPILMILLSAGLGILFWK